MEPKRAQWGSKIGFILAAAGSAVGLGNIWGFPYKMGKSGGAVFLLFYLVLVVLVGVTVMLGELALGRRSGKSGVFWSCSRYPDCKGTQPVEDTGAGKRGASSRASGPPRRRPRAN